VSEILMDKPGFALVPFSSYRALFLRSEVRSEAQPPAPMRKTGGGDRRGLSRRGAQRPAILREITGSLALADGTGRVLATGILASVSSTFQERRDGPSDCREKSDGIAAFYRRQDDGGHKGFGVPVTGLSGLQNHLNTRAKLSAENSPGRLLFDGEPDSFKTRSRKALQTTNLGSFLNEIGFCKRERVGAGSQGNQTRQTGDV